jgi:uncharacterized membrane protein
MKHNIKKLVQIALFCALVTVGTMAITIPVPVTQGFINFGDSIIFVAAALFGPIGGMLAGAIGSSTADLLLGYAHWAPFTFVIKGMEGLICGAMLQYFMKEKKESRKFLLQLIACCVGGLVMMGGYYLAGGAMYGFPAALTELGANAIQAGGSVIIGLLLVRILFRINLPFGE